jgi:hypothetical protein
LLRNFGFGVFGFISFIFSDLYIWSAYIFAHFLRSFARFAVRFVCEVGGG